jgi:hypothetical protein
MELIEIIKSSLSIFSTTTVVFIIISYTIFKIKDRSRIKPYLKFNVQKPIGSIIKDEIGINIDLEEKPSEEMQFDRIVLNKLPIQDKFTIINGEVIADRLKKLEHKKENSLNRLNPSDGKKNVFGFYAIQNENMDKLKLVTR